MGPWQLTPWDWLDMIIRLLMAAILGGIIGYERETERKPAGARTHLIVCAGATLFTIASIYGFGDGSDPSRIAAGIVVGIGFLGAGMIFRERGTIVGLTTAATIWATAAIGLCLGAGLYPVAWATAAIVFIALRFIPHHHG